MKKVVIFIALLVAWGKCHATIDIAIKTPEGVVFASDSRVTGDNTEIISDTYEKIVKVSRFVMVQAVGSASPGNKNLKTTIQDFRWKFHFSDTASICIDSIINMFVRYCEKERKGGTDYTGFTINFAGPDSAGSVQYFQYLPGIQSPPRQGGYDVYWVGIPNTSDRLIKGIDAEMRQRIDSLFKGNVSGAKGDSARAKLDEIIDQYGIVRTQRFDWSLQDAIDYAYMLVYTTILVDRMSLGKYRDDEKKVNPLTGGRIIECAVTRDGAQWILPPNYAPKQ